MRQQPQIFTAHEIKHWHTETQVPADGWQPARPMPFQTPWWRTDMLRMRLHAAWGVLIGRYDALNWNPSRGHK